MHIHIVLWITFARYFKSVTSVFLYFFLGFLNLRYIFDVDFDAEMAVPLSIFFCRPGGIDKGNLSPMVWGLGETAVGYWTSMIRLRFFVALLIFSSYFGTCVRENLRDERIWVVRPYGKRYLKCTFFFEKAVDSYRGFQIEWNARCIVIACESLGRSDRRYRFVAPAR